MFTHNYISHNSLPGLIIPDYHIHLCLIILFSSPHKSLVYLIIPCEVLYVILLQFRAFPVFLFVPVVIV